MGGRNPSTRYAGSPKQSCCQARPRAARAAYFGTVETRTEATPCFRPVEVVAPAKLAPNLVHRTWAQDVASHGYHPPCSTRAAAECSASSGLGPRHASRGGGLGGGHRGP